MHVHKEVGEGYLGKLTLVFPTCKTLFLTVKWTSCHAVSKSSLTLLEQDTFSTGVAFCHFSLRRYFVSLHLATALSVHVPLEEKIVTIPGAHMSSGWTAKQKPPVLANLYPCIPMVCVPMTRIIWFWMPGSCLLTQSSFSVPFPSCKVPSKVLNRLFMYVLGRNRLFI